MDFKRTNLRSFSSLESLRALFEVRSKDSARERVAKIDFHQINVLPQPRKTFEQISELALNIAENGLLNPPIVARFDWIRAIEYLGVINQIWETDFNVSNLISVSEKYDILIAGERRLRALRLLWDQGCEICQDKHGQEPKGICFKRHLRNEKIGVSLWQNISPFRALFFQFSENIYQPPPPAEEAEAYQRLFKLVRQIDPGFPIARFARCVGKSSNTISNALAFCELPDVIQEVAKKPVKQGGIAYGITLQLTRLQKQNASKENLLWWMTRAMVGSYKVEKFKKLVDAYLTEKASGQVSLFKIMTAEQEKVAKKAFIRKTVEKNTVQEIWSYIFYFKRVLELFEHRQLGFEDSPFSVKSPRRVYRELIRLMGGSLFDHMENVLPVKAGCKAEQVLKDAKKLVTQLEKEFGKIQT